MRLVGLTGGMGCGKTTVSRRFQALGVHIVDADLLAKKVVEPGQRAYENLVDEFGSTILDQNNEIDRKGLAKLAFADPNRLEKLNEITHSEIQLLKQSEFQAILFKEPEALIMYVVPLLFEKAMQSEFQKVVLVTLDRAVQVRRLIELRDFTAEEVEARLKHQLPQNEKLALADFIIDNNGSLDQTHRQVDQVYQSLLDLPSELPENLGLELN